MNSKIVFGALLLSVALCSRGFAGDCGACSPVAACSAEIMLEASHRPMTHCQGSSPGE